MDVVEEHIAAFRAADTPRALSFLDPHLVWEGSRTGGAEDVTYGIAALDDFVRRYRGAFEGYDYEVEGLQDLGAGSVLAVVTEIGSGRTSGVPVNRSFAALYTVIDGKIARITLFPTEQAARQAVGLRE
jgi:ketosteroid isomerase-like protein